MSSQLHGTEAIVEEVTLLKTLHSRGRMCEDKCILRGRGKVDREGMRFPEG